MNLCVFYDFMIWIWWLFLEISWTISNF